MFDKYVGFNMTAIHDPYRELELYLEQAQEEIGKAIKELENYHPFESTDEDDNEPITCNALLPPPQAFRSSSPSYDTFVTEDGSSPEPTVKRVCHDGNLVDIQNSLHKDLASDRFNSPEPSFATCLNPGSLGRYKKKTYSPNTKRRLWQMHPSISFPETSKDLLLLHKDLATCGHTKNSNSSAKECLNDSFHHNSKSLTLNSSHHRTRQRSNSDTAVPCVTSDGPENFFIPAPPNEDFNLLSAWANNLVLELDKNFSVDFNSSSNLSPSSDYSLSPNKVDDVSESSNGGILHLQSLHSPGTDVVDTGQVSVSQSSLKSVSMSPDSGIEQLCCETPDTIDESSLSLKSKLEEDNFDISMCLNDNITQPPDKFCDEVNKFEQDRCNSVPISSNKKSKYREQAQFCAAVSTLESEEIPEALLNSSPNVQSIARVIAPKAVELQNCVVSRTTCTVSHFPKSEKLDTKSSDRSCTLPRGSSKNSNLFKRSISQSSVSAINSADVNELTALVQRMKSASSQSPPCADAGTDATENQDAVTQTTPVPLSRSSSFTWVTECDCSDWELNNINSGSDESFLENCPSCKKERRTQKSSSSSSIELSSDDDGVSATPGSGSSSSLYLSACSGSSDSFEEACLLIEEVKQTVENDFIFPSRRSLRCSETTLCASSTLGDICEEQQISDTMSMKSTTSNPSLADSNNGDPLEQSASFPSTLKVTRKSKSTSSPSQPIEPTVLIVNEYNLKSVSAPVLLRKKRPFSAKTPGSSSCEFSDTKNQDDQVPARSHSAKELNELQAIEACSWLRAAGFPQYAQMYEDNQFPIDVSIVQKDHAFLPPDSIQSLFRRLNTLNRCANMKFVDHTPRKSLRVEDSDEEEQYALSENWEFQRSSRRWSRITATSDGIPDFVIPDHQEPIKPSTNFYTIPGKKYLRTEDAYCSSHDSVFVDEQQSSPDSVRRSSTLKPDRISISPSHVGDCSPGSSSGSGGTLSLASVDLRERRSLRRSGSDRVKEGAKALLKRMESLKGKRKKKGCDSKKAENSFPYSGTDGSSSSSLTSSPQFHRSLKLPDSIHNVNLRTNYRKELDPYSKNDDDVSVHSDSECHMILLAEKWKDANSNETKHFKQIKTSQTKITITSTSAESSLKSNSLDSKSNVQAEVSKAQLLHPYSSINQETDNKRGSYYDNITAPIVVFNDFCNESFDKSPEHNSIDERQSTLNYRDVSKNQDNGEIIVISNERRDSGFGSSLTRGITCIHAPWHCFPSHSISEVKQISCPVKITDLTAPQILLLRKLSLLKLTAIMERFSPSNRTGWSWAVPKFIRRIRNPDYKDKNIFGVPLLLILQRTGQPLPVSIQAAIHYLRTTAIESTGLFRKSGVRSRIQKLKNMNESNPNNITYEEQQAYDVADMLKQYFRELPEALLTNKLSETFISIFQFIPEDLRLEAIQAALLLMPDENREVLQALLEFLSEVCQHSGANQMTATNLAVCFAPSLFHLSSPRSESSSPRRRKTVGIPDPRELNENRAAYECLSCMVSNYKTLFSISEEMVAQSRISTATYTEPATLDEITSFAYDSQAGLKGYVDSCVQMFLKETKEKYKSFVNFSQYDHVEISYKKLSDGHPLRLWKVSTEVEAPPSVLLNRLLRERQLWDPSFSKPKIVVRLSNNMEIFQYLCSALPPHPPCDYCVLRSWRTDLPRGACVLIETSVNHPEAEVHSGSVRALTLASRYLIEPCGSGKSRITHLSRIDTRGRSPEWYNRAYGHICTLLLIKLRNSFSPVCTDGPETKL